LFTSILLLFFLPVLLFSRSFLCVIHILLVAVRVLCVVMSFFLVVCRCALLLLSGYAVVFIVIYILLSTHCVDRTIALTTSPSATVLVYVKVKFAYLSSVLVSCFCVLLCFVSEIFFHSRTLVNSILSKFTGTAVL